MANQRESTQRFIEQKTYYLVLKLSYWKDLVPAQPLKVKFPQDCGVGYTPLFTSKEDALKHYPDAKIVEVNLVTEVDKF